MCVNSRPFRFAASPRAWGDGVVEHEIPMDESTKKTNEYDRATKEWMGECSLDFLDRLIPPWNTLGYPSHTEYCSQSDHQV
jgi:hypothetical protein